MSSENCCSCEDVCVGAGDLETSLVPRRVKICGFIFFYRIRTAFFQIWENIDMVATIGRQLTMTDLKKVFYGSNW